MCNCKKPKEQPPVPEPTPIPVEDHFNNIDTITPIEDGE